MSVERVDYSTEEDYQQALAWEQEQMRQWEQEEQEQMRQWEQEECASCHGRGVDLFLPDTECQDCHGKKNTPNKGSSVPPSAAGGG